MAEYDTVPPEADAKQNALEQPGFAERTDDEKDAPQKPPEDRKDPISSSKDERSPSGIDKRIPPPSRPPYDCPDAGCTWPCAHHVHRFDERFWVKIFDWFPDLENIPSHYGPKIPRVQSKMNVGMKDCQFCQIFFGIGQSDCGCGANAQNSDHISKSGGCQCEVALCLFRSNGQLDHMDMNWECGHFARYELGLPTAPGRDFPYIAPCMGDLHGDPGSDESLALMKGWIDNCQHRHQLCMEMPQQVGRPKRLLQCLSDDFVRLVETTQRCDYIALSYCWGDGKAVLKTTEKTTEEAISTLDRHQSGIPDKDLPPLYQEVVALAQGLNIRYLWIDSLCIVQDSPEDKSEEISKMSDIFRGALVVVVAATAKSPLDSLLRVKPQDQSHIWRTASLVSYQEMDLDVKFRKRYGRRPHDHRDATSSTPIARRAWCFQEKLLASRCLVFCEDEVVWECRSCCLCECSGEQEHFSEQAARFRTMKRYQQMLLPLAEHDTLTAFAQLPFTEHEPFLDGTLAALAQLPFAEHEPLQLDGPLRYFADAEAAYSFWETVVENYSDRALSFETDRLPAISAVASIVAEATGDRYLAGLWRNDLLAGLAWIIVLNLASQTPRPNYIAPTWSWASISTRVEYYEHWRRTRHLRDTDLDALVLDACTALEGQNPCGPVSDGAILLSGFHCDAELTIPKSGMSGQFDFGHAEVQTVRAGRFYHHLDQMLVEPDTTNVDLRGGNLRYLRRATDQKRMSSRPACSGTARLLWLEENVCLILTPSHRKKGAYERLGIIHKGWFDKHGYDFNLKIPKTAQRSMITLV